MIGALAVLFALASWFTIVSGLQTLMPWKRRRTISSAPTTEVMDASHALQGFRRLLEWLEVTGPGVGFLLTVASLLVAFDPSVFAERNYGKFTEAISLAMGATAVGLLIRVLAFSLDRIVEHMARWDANRLGLIEIPREGSPQTATSSASPAVQPDATAALGGE